MMTTVSLEIAGLGLTLRLPHAVTVPAAFQPFLASGSFSNAVTFAAVPSLPDVTPAGPCLTGFRIVRDPQNRICRLFLNINRANRPYALSYPHWNRHTPQVWFLADQALLLRDLGRCFSLIGWENLLILEHRIILHAACVRTPLGGLLFAGPSGAGKSTQAELWVRYGGARLLNGDRTIVERQPDRWLGHGSPFAGSSRCYRRESAPIRAIFLPIQASACRLRTLDAGEAFQRLFSLTTVNSWSPDYVNLVCDLLEQLVQQVPVYMLSCTPGPEAVALVQEALVSPKEAPNRHAIHPRAPGDPAADRTSVPHLQPEDHPAQRHL